MRKLTKQERQDNTTIETFTVRCNGLVVGQVSFIQAVNPSNMRYVIHRGFKITLQGQPSITSSVTFRRKERVIELVYSILYAKLGYKISLQKEV